MAIGTLEKKVPKQVFFLNGPALYPPPHLMDRPLREELSFFAASLELHRVLVALNLQWSSFAFPFVEVCRDQEIIK